MRKESRQIIRDPSSILIAVLLPLILLFLFGYGVSLEPRRIEIGFLVDNQNQDTRDLEAAFESSPYFDTVSSASRAALEEGLVTGRLKGIVAPDPRFAAMAERGEAAPIALLVNGSDPNTAALVQYYVQGAWSNWTVQRAAERGPGSAPGARIEIESRMWFNPAREGRNSMVPASIAIILTIICTLLTSLVVAREWERGTMEALLATPVSPAELLVGKYVPYFGLGMAGATLCVGAALLVFHVPLRGSPLLLAGVTAIFVITGLSFGLLISTVTRNQFLASQIALVAAFLPSFALSGVVFEIDSMPRPIQLITYLIPARYYVDAVRTLFLAGNGGAVATDALIMAAMGLVLTAATLRQSRNSLE